MKSKTVRNSKLTSKSSGKLGRRGGSFFEQYNFVERAMLFLGLLFILTSLFLVFTQQDLRQKLTGFLIRYEFQEKSGVELEFLCSTDEWQELNDSYRECVEKYETNRPANRFSDYPSDVGKYCETKFPKYDIAKDQQKGTGYVVNLVKKFLFIPISSTPHHYKLTSPALYAEEFLISDTEELDSYQKNIDLHKKYNHKSCILMN